jgi:galactosylceramidase
MVTRISPDAVDFSIVIEKMDTADSTCARGSNPAVYTAEEEVKLHLMGSFAKAKKLHVWYSNLTSANDIRVNPDDEQVFVEKDPLVVAADGTVTLTVKLNEIYTLTTLTTGSKGAKKSPPSKPFPLPFKQSFDDEVGSRLLIDCASMMRWGVGY